MGTTQPAGRNRPLSEINVTPFVDVVLVLLIIFMVTAPMMQQGVDVDLPETTTQPLRMRDEPLILTIQKEGKYYLGRSEVPLSELKTKLEAIFEGRKPDARTVVLLSLAHGTRLLQMAFEKKELKERKKRIEALIESEALGKAVKSVVEAAQVAVMAATVSG